MKIHKIETKRGAKVRVLEAGSGAPLVFMHGAGGLFPENPFLDRLAKLGTMCLRQSFLPTANQLVKNYSRICSTSPCTGGMSSRPSD